MKTEIFDMTHSVNRARYWSLVALAQAMLCSEREVQTCPLKGTLAEVGDDLRGLELEGICRGIRFKVACSLRRQADGSWRIDLVAINTGDRFLIVSPRTDLGFFPGYPKELTELAA